MPALAVPLAAAALAAAAFAREKAPSPAAPAPLTFRDVTKRAGLRFSFSTDLRHGRMIATMGGGVAVGDYDGDGWLDLFLTGSAASAERPEAGPCGVLLHNRGDGTFEDATARSGIRSCGWQMGASWVDYDSDGRPDLIVEGLGCTRVWHNDGGGRFHDATASLGIDLGQRFTIGLAAGDVFGDGRVALYFVNYLDTTPAKEMAFPALQIRLPEDYEGEPAVLLRRGEDGRYSDATAASGADNAGGKGTGGVLFDYDGDGRPDIYVANDRVTNRLYRNLGGGRFEDVTDAAGAGARGPSAYAGMGIAIGDPFGEGRPSIYVTNYAGQPNTLYRNVAGELFDDATEASNAGRQAWPYVQWGTGFDDFDDDGWPDLYSVSGQLVPHVLMWIARVFGHSPRLASVSQGDLSYRGPITLWRNTGEGRFADAAATAGDLANVRLCARGAGTGDFDGDGRLDVVVAAISGGPRLFRNTTARSGHAIEILPVAGSDGRTALGTKVRVTAGGRTQVSEFIVRPSYASGAWAPLHFGLGAAAMVDRIEIVRPWSTQPELVATDVPADALYRLRDGGLTLVRRFRR